MCWKKRYIFRWTDNDDEIKGEIILCVSYIKLHEKMWWFNRPCNDPSSWSYVPFALCIEGKIEKEEGFHFDKAQRAYALVPETDLEESNIKLQTGDRVRLYLNKERKCVKFEKLNHTS